MCPHACRCALLQNSYIDTDTTITLLVHDNDVMIPHVAATGIFRPPKLPA